MNHRIFFSLLASLFIVFGAFTYLVGLNKVSLYAEAATSDSSSVIGVDLEEMILGDVNAPVTIVEYASFTCPHCKDFHLENFLKLKKEYINTGKVKFIFREVYFDKYGLWAGMVARCGGSKSYFGLIDMIFEKQSEWVTGEVAEVVDKLKRIGKTSGLTNEDLEVCLQDTANARALVEAYRVNSVEDNIQSTPSFVINGKLHSNMDYDDLVNIINKELN
ncbi:MAG: DsbA family protein [Rhodobacterales bacterium]